MIDAWLSLPLPALIFVLTAFYSTSALVLVRVSFGATAGPWVRSFRGVVAPFAGAIVIIFSILVGFLANDVWDRNRRAAATVRGEGASLISLHALAAALGTPHVAIDRAIRAYAAPVLADPLFALASAAGKWSRACQRRYSSSHAPLSRAITAGERFGGSLA